jgi:N-acetylneuraminate lyase
MVLGGLALGADGGVGSTYNVLGSQIKRLADHFQEGRMTEALAEQREINEVIAALIRVGVIQGLKVLLNMAGVDIGVCRAPFEMPGEKEQEELRAVAARYLELPVT